MGLIARDVNEEAAEWFARTDPLTLRLAPPQTLEDVALDTRRLLVCWRSRTGNSPDERIRQARLHSTRSPNWQQNPRNTSSTTYCPLDERMEQALSTPQLGGHSGRRAGPAGNTPSATGAGEIRQRPRCHPLADRQAAAAAFRTAVSAAGLLLTRDQLLQQYDIYNASEFLDSDTQQVLASILDAIESSIADRPIPRTMS